MRDEGTEDIDFNSGFFAGIGSVLWLCGSVVVCCFKATNA